MREPCETITTGTRAVTLAYSTDDLVSITNPDNGVHTFGYDAYHKLTSEAFGSVEGTYAYDTYGLLSGTTSGVNTDAIRTELNPVAKLGLDILHAGTRSATTIDANNNTWQSVLDSYGRVLETLAPNGATTKVTRDADGWITSSTDPLGRTTTYTLDAKGFVTQVTNPDSTTRQFTYANNAYHSMLTSTNERGYTTTYGYDGLGHNTVIENALNELTTIGYHATSGLVETVQDARNNITTYAYDTARRLETTTYADGGTITLTYDANGNLETQTNQRGFTTTYTNDVMGRATLVENPDGSTASYAYDALGLNTASTDRGGIVSANTINTRGQISKTTQGVGLSLERSNLVQFNALGQTSSSRDAMGYWNHATHNAIGQQTHSTNPLGNSSETVYDLAGQVIQTRNELGQTTKYVYDARGRVVETIDNANVRTTSVYDNAGNLTVYKDALGGVVTTSYDALNRAYQVQTSATQITTTTFDEVGNVKTTIDAGNKTTTYTYDNVNRQKTITTPTNDTTTFNYDLAGNQTEVINARGKITTSVYDSMNRVLETITPDNESTFTDYLLSGAIEKITNALNEVTTILNDALFQTIGSINALNQQSNQILDALGRTVVNIDASGKQHTNWYDELGRNIGSVDGLGSSTRNDYDAAGNLIRSIDANGNTTEYQYDNLGRLSVTIDPNGGRITQTYDNNGNLRTYTDPLGNTTTFTYDNQGREIQRTDALGNSLTYTYDSRNLMLSQTDRLGRRKDWTYDDNGRVETETWFTSGSPVNTLTYTYDANGNLLTASDNNGNYTLTYDNQDRLASQTGLYGVALTFSYDDLGRRNRIEDSFNGVMSSVYDAAGRLETRQFGGTGQATLTYERDYSDNGELLAARRYSDLTSTNLIGSTTYGYDAGYRLTSIQHKDGTGANIAAYTMTFDNGGRITEENRNGTSVTYSYDTRSQLTQAGADAYSYDDNGNRTMAGYTTGGMNQLTNDGTFTYTYDLEGNVSTKSKGPGLEKWYYSYDHNNRLLSVRKTSDGSTDTLTVTYSYDVFGNRVKEDKWSSGPGLVTTKFVYVGQEVYLDLDNADDLLMRYIQGDTTDEMLVRIDGGNNVAWFLTDRLGSIRDIVDDTGTVIDSITYDAYGKITAETNSANRGNYGAFGYVFDSDTGYAIMPAGRPYFVDTGRFGGHDQIWNLGGLSNFYGYTGNNPTNATDPSGYQIQIPPPAQRGTLPTQHYPHQVLGNSGDWIDLRPLNDKPVGNGLPPRSGQFNMRISAPNLLKKGDKPLEDDEAGRIQRDLALCERILKRAQQATPLRDFLINRRDYPSLRAEDFFERAGLVSTDREEMPLRDETLRNGRLLLEAADVARKMLFILDEMKSRSYVWIQRVDSESAIITGAALRPNYYDPKPGTTGGYRLRYLEINIGANAPALDSWRYEVSPEFPMEKPGDSKVVPVEIYNSYFYLKSYDRSKLWLSHLANLTRHFSADKADDAKRIVNILAGFTEEAAGVAPSIIP